MANTWTPLASMPVALYDARAAYAANVNKVYVFGGFNGSGHGDRHGLTFRPNLTSGFGEGLAFFREFHLHAGLHDEPREEPGSDRHKTGQNYP